MTHIGYMLLYVCSAILAGEFVGNMLILIKRLIDFLKEKKCKRNGKNEDVEIK